jgi:hypothetical protein
MKTEEVFSAYEHAAKTLKYARITKRTNHSINIQINTRGGKGTVRLFLLFPAVFLGVNEFTGSSFPAYNGEVATGLKINFCIDGRCEVKMSDSKYLFPDAGNLSIDTRIAWDKFTFPYDRFLGIELFIHDSALRQNPPTLFRDASIDMIHLCKKYCPDNQTFIAQASEKVKSIFVNTSEPMNEGELDYFRIKVTELLFLLTHMEKPTENERHSFFTMGQVKIAKQVMEIITADLSEH